MNLITKAGYSGIVFDVEEVEGSSEKMNPAFDKAFMLAKSINLVVGITISHSAPYKTDTAKISIELVKSWVANDNIDFLSP